MEPPVLTTKVLGIMTEQAASLTQEMEQVALDKIAARAEMLRHTLQAAKARLLKAEQLAQRGAATLSISGWSREACQAMLEQVQDVGERTRKIAKSAKKGTAAAEQSRRDNFKKLLDVQLSLKVSTSPWRSILVTSTGLPEVVASSLKLQCFRSTFEATEANSDIECRPPARG